MAFDPDSGIGVLVSTNSITGIGIERVLSNAILQAAVYEKTGTLDKPTPDLSVAPVALSADELGALEGIYMLAGDTRFLKIAVADDDGVLYIHNITGLPFPLGLVPLSDGSFVNPDTGLRFWFEELFDEMALFLGDYKTHLVGARLDLENFLPDEGFERWIGVYVPYEENEDYISIVSAIDIGIEENGLAYMTVYALHGQNSISPMHHINDNTYSGNGIIEFSMVDGAAWMTFAGASFVRVS